MENIEQAVLITSSKKKLNLYLLGEDVVALVRDNQLLRFTHPQAEQGMAFSPALLRKLEKKAKAKHGVAGVTALPVSLTVDHAKDMINQRVDFALTIPVLG